MADVKWTFFADTAAAERGIVALEQKYAKLENQIAQSSRKSKEGATGASAALGGVMTKLAGAAAGYLTLTGAIGGAIAANKELQRAADEAANKQDLFVRKFRIQAGLGELQGDAAKKSILAASQAAGFTSEQGFGSATQLVSSGFSAEQAQGPALLALLKVAAASNQVGEEADTKSIAHAITSYLNSQGKALTAENLESTGVAFQRLFKSKDIQLEDLAAVAKVGSVMAGKLTQEEQFAAAAVLKTEGGLPGAESATALRNMVLAMTAQGLDKKKVETLAGFGLTPGDIDLQGETFLEAMTKLSDGMKKLGPEQVDPLLKQFFEKENVAGARTLLGNLEKLESLTKIQGDVAGFNVDVTTATAGRGARGQRLKLAEEEALAPLAGEFGTEAVLRALRISEREIGRAPFSTSLSERSFGMARGFGASERTAIGLSVGSEAQANRIVELLEENAKAANEQVGLLKKIEIKNPPLNRKAQGEGAPQ